MIPMSKKVLIISGSPRKGNSDMLCEEFRRGAVEAGNEVEKIDLRSKRIGFCRGCYRCTEKGRCVIDDDVPAIVDAIHDADVIVMASPVYFYSIDAQLKAVIDRCVSRWTEMRDKQFYYIATAAEDTEVVADCTIQCMRGLADCLDGSVEKGIILGKGVHEAGEVEGTEAMREAYEMGRRVR